MRNLACSELFKYEYRVSTFIAKYEKEEPFTLLNGSEVSFTYSSQIKQLIEERKSEQLKGSILEGKDNSFYKLSDLEKTREFGGKGAGFGVRIEDMQITEFNQKYSHLTPFNIVLGNVVYTDIVKLEKTPGTPKSDFHFVDIKGNEVIWLSHKNGSKPSHFQQYSGLTEKEIISHPEVQSFIENVRASYTDIPKAVTIARPINDENLRHKAVYGADYSKENWFWCNYGRQNVHAIIQGKFDLQSTPYGYYILSGKITTNSIEMKDGYKPMMMCYYRGDRNQFGINGARFSISAEGSRRIDLVI